jgi:hypothetical protein
MARFVKRINSPEFAGLADDVFTFKAKPTVVDEKKSKIPAITDLRCST